MKNILLLSGASLNSRAWARNLLESLITSGVDATLFEYDHWVNGGELDIEKEAKKLRLLLEANSNITKIIAKSAGSIIAMIAEQGSNDVVKNVFIGVPIEYAKDRNIDLESVVSKNFVTTICIQAENDTMGSYGQAVELFKSSKSTITVRVDGDSHQYPNLELLTSRVAEYLSE